MTGPRYNAVDGGVYRIREKASKLAIVLSIYKEEKNRERKES
jgi:hypothetical protein